ncbi:uracil-DNA glycosylase [Rhodoferax sp.]|jgi:uracil-DNA glycosylase|uniref:uracil-DNA glycosylase n=1 Tax=Rhodoferax sp. TaxID=50421 RepID=UPI0037830638
MPLDLDARQRAMLEEMGVHVWLPIADTVASTPGASDAMRDAGAAPAQAAPRAVAALHAPTRPLDSAGWTDLQQAAAQCQACGLCAGRSRSTLLPITGHADWMVVGDPPDEAEDAVGRPFVHDAGVLLDNMLAALGLTRSTKSAEDSHAQSEARPAADPEARPHAHLGATPGAGIVAPAALAYVTNVVKCRPPHGTLVQANDLAQCATYLQREIALVQPKVILAMGRFANQLLLGETPELATLPLGKLRGQVHHYRGIAVLPTYHPKALLRNPADKAKAWVDLCLAAEVVDGVRPN